MSLEKKSRRRGGSQRARRAQTLEPQMMMWPQPAPDMLAAWNAFQMAPAVDGGANPYGGIFFQQGPQGQVMPMAFSPPPGVMAPPPQLGPTPAHHPGASGLLGSPPGIPPVMQPVLSAGKVSEKKHNTKHHIKISSV